MTFGASCVVHTSQRFIQPLARPVHRRVPLPTRATPRRSLSPVCHAYGGCCGHSETEDYTHSSKFHSTLTRLTSVFGLVDWIAHLQHQSLGLGLAIAGLALFHVSSSTRLLGEGLVLFLSGLPLFRAAILSASRLQVDAGVLMTLATGGSIWLGFPGEGLMLLLLFQFAHLLEDKFTNQSKKSLEELLGNSPDTGVVVKMDLETLQPDLESAETVPAEEIGIGSFIAVKPGEVIPLDGEVISGRALVSVGHITGETLPIQVSIGSKVPAGSCNVDGLLVLKTLTELKDSTPWKIAKLAVDAQNNKPKVQRWIDQILTVWSKCALLVAALVALGSVYIAKVPLFGYRGALYRALCIVTAAAPCALVLTPLAYVCALANASRHNVLIKSASILDSLRNCKQVVFDKTGTLTEGKLICTEILNQEDLDQVTNGGVTLEESPKKLQALCHAVELSKRSTHPISSAILDAGRRHLLSKNGNFMVSDFALIPGEGVQGVIAPNSSPPVFASLGSFDFVETQLGRIENGGLDLEEARGVVHQRHNGNSVSVLTTHERDGGNLEWSAFCFKDQLQILTRSAINALQNGSWKAQRASEKHSKKLTILTGDTQSSAQAVGEALGIDEIHAGINPAEKQEFVKALQESGDSGVVMVGDGINDAPALSQADVGISISETASGLSAGSAEVIILNGKGVANLPFLFKLSDRVRNVIIQNLIITFSAMMLSCVPALSGMIPLWLAVVFHEGSSILTAMNSCKLLLVQADDLKKM